jgi:hypothetical protein
MVALAAPQVAEVQAPVIHQLQVVLYPQNTTKHGFTKYLKAP